MSTVHLYIYVMNDLLHLGFFAPAKPMSTCFASLRSSHIFRLFEAATRVAVTGLPQYSLNIEMNVKRLSLEVKLVKLRASVHLGGPSVDA